MKIGLIVYGSLDSITGGNVFDRKLVDRLRARGDQVEIVSLRRRSYLGHLTDNFSARLGATVDVLLQDELVHPSLLIPNARRRRYPIVSIVHNLRSSERRPRWQNAMYRLVEKRYLCSVDAFVFNSQTTLETVRTGLGVNKPSVVATPGGNRLGSWTPEAVRARAFESGPLRLLFLANVTTLKGLRILLDALAALQQSRFELDVVGSCEAEPPYARAMERQASRLGVHIVFHGALDGRPLIEKLRRAQVMVIPSYYEGFGIAYLEGMAFGLPAIGTYAGAIPEIITSGVNGFLVSPGDSQTLAARLSALAADRGLLARMAGCALGFFKTRPTWNQSGDAIRDFLLTMLDGKTSESP